MSDEPSPLEFPELVLGLAGPIGIDADSLTRFLQKALGDVGYGTQLIRVTEEVDVWQSGVARPEDNDFYSVTTFKMDHSNELCRKFKDPAALARIVLRSIKDRRQSLIKGLARGFRASPSDDPAEPAAYDSQRAVPKTAYIIRQLKRPEEVELLRRVYGKQFMLISAYGGREDRKSSLLKRIKGDLRISVEEKELSFKADDLIFRDSLEGQDEFGQHLRDTFHLADFFVDGINHKEMESGIRRFVRALFGRNDISPTRSEYGMYAAKAASLRSLDLSRQIGAAIFSPNGELVTQGCNEVPRAFGGTYWDQEEPDFRDIKLGVDPNDQLKKDMLRDLLERLDDGGFLSKEAIEIGSSQQLVIPLYMHRRWKNQTQTPNNRR